MKKSSKIIFYVLAAVCIFYGIYGIVKIGSADFPYDPILQIIMGIAIGYLAYSKMEVES